VGWTDIVKLARGPIQLLAVGVTEMLASIVFDVLLTGVKGVIFPVPLAARLMDVLLFVQA
jgi:hypothetical protein